MQTLDTNVLVHTSGVTFNQRFAQTKAVRLLTAPSP
jgi:hypothetical protein